MARSPPCELRTGRTVQSVDQDDDWAYGEYRDVHGQVKRLRGKFLVGADGKTGYTRKHYLEPRGVKMENATESGNPLPSPI
jgi:2-polyprenyl-6-methoxyphenol hydroxylase-like FAD-dependent oxidoreductase